jgi:hypothetical protein
MFKLIRMIWTGILRVWRRIEMHIGLVERSEGKRLLGRSRYRWEENIKVISK